MPIYEYRCQKCGAEREVMQKLTDPPPEACEKCGEAGAMEKLMSRSSFQLKGGGWYSDLYASTKKDSKSESSPGASGSDAKSTTPAPATSGAAPASTAAAPAAAPAAKPATPSTSGSGGSSGGGSKP